MPMGSTASLPGTVPHFPVELSAPDIGPWLAGNTGVPGVTALAGPRPGPHVVLVALLHGNEIAGALVLDRLLREHVQPGARPADAWCSPTCPPSPASTPSTPPRRASSTRT